MILDKKFFMKKYIKNVIEIKNILLTDVFYGVINNLLITDR